MAKRRSKRIGSSVLEMTVLMAVLILVIVLGHPLLKNALWGRWKSIAGQISNEPFSLTKESTSVTRSQSARHEETGNNAKAADGLTYSESVVMNGTQFSTAFSKMPTGAKETAYRGAETNWSYYGKTGTLSNQVADEDALNLGKVTDEKLFNN